jgi:hypothetical protein
MLSFQSTLKKETFMFCFGQSNAKSILTVNAYDVPLGAPEIHSPQVANGDQLSGPYLWVMAIKMRETETERKRKCGPSASAIINQKGTCSYDKPTMFKCIYHIPVITVALMCCVIREIVTQLGTVSIF